MESWESPICRMTMRYATAKATDLFVKVVFPSTDASLEQIQDIVDVL